MFSNSEISLPVRTEIFWAMILPPTTPSPVQIAWPMIPPVITPIRFSLAARIIVVIWERSPHSATKVIVKACMKILRRTLKAPGFAFPAPPISGSVVRTASLLAYFWTRTWRKMEKRFKNKSISILSCDVIRQFFTFYCQKKKQNGKEIESVVWPWV